MRNHYAVGEKYHRWTILSDAGFNSHGQRMVLCRCDCGVERIVRAANLKSATRSCGCLNKDIITKHGLEKTPEYSRWNQMINRCHNPNYPGFHEYGAIGIKVCDAWRNSPVGFIDHIGKKPDGDFSVDRIDSTKGYEPGNVRWASKSEQCYNRRIQQGKTSRYRGVYLHIQTGKWIAHISTSTGRQYLGIHNSEEEAYSVYVAAYIKEHGHRPPYEI